ncbi:endospore germination permease [Clostridium algidicarnis]|uniref:Endospore germination permease n=2 Tax=Clostridium algidicarnis TaxID=37659 RepID=A0ABS6C536_9CLOT|nr:endospore germination permease [Clostridium algidicarnis]
MLQGSHAKVFIVSKDIAKEGIVPVIDLIDRDVELRNDMWILISESDTASDILRKGKEGSEIISYELAASIGNSNKIRDFIDFIKLTALFNTPSAVTSICIGVLVIWMLKEGIEVMAAWSQFFIRIILVFVILVWILLIPEMDITNLQPIFYSGFKAISKESLKLVIFPFSGIFIFMTFFDYLDCDKKSKNIFVKPLIIGGVIIVVFTLLNIMILGGEDYNSFYYSGYEAIKRLELHGEFQRAEVIVSIVFTIIQFLQISFCVLGVSKGVTKVFNLKEYRNILIPIVILMINFVQIMFKSIMEAMEFTNDLWPSYALLMQVIFPFIIFIGALLKKRYSVNNKKV